MPDVESRRRLGMFGSARLCLALLRRRPAALALDALDTAVATPQSGTLSRRGSASLKTMRLSLSVQGIGKVSTHVCMAQCDALLSNSAVRTRSRSTPSAYASLKPS